jgi:Uma2 family endonuclease
MGTVQSWLKAGVRVVWVVDPASRTVTVHRNDAAVRLLRDGDVLRGDDDVLPDFVVPLPELWA